MSRLGIAPHMVERVLNYVSATFAGVAGIYNRFRDHKSATNKSCAPPTKK